MSRRSEGGGPCEEAAPTTTTPEVEAIVPDVAATVAEILGAALPEWSGLPAMVRDLRRIAWATRVVLDRVDYHQFDPEKAGALLAALDRAAHAHPLGPVAREAVFREIDDWRLDPPPAWAPDVAAEQLHRAGYRSCPVCLSELRPHGLITLHKTQRAAYEAHMQLRERRRAS